MAKKLKIKFNFDTRKLVSLKEQRPGAHGDIAGEPIQYSKPPADAECIYVWEEHNSPGCRYVYHNGIGYRVCD